MKITATQSRILMFVWQKILAFFLLIKGLRGKIQFGFDTDIGQRTETNEQLQDLISYTLYSVSSNVRYNHSPKFGVGSDVTYELRNYQRLSSQGLPYHDMQSYALGLHLTTFTHPNLISFSITNTLSTKAPTLILDFINNTQKTTLWEWRVRSVLNFLKPFF